MMTRLEDQTIVITGGGSGIGQGTALRCLELGANVVLGDLSPEGIAHTESMVSDAGLSDRLVSVKIDVCSEPDVSALIQTAVTEFGDLHAVFNNAGADLASGDIGEMDADGWDRTISLLLRGPFLGIKHAVSAFRKLGHGGSIVSTSSIAGHLGGCSSVAYASAKAGVVSLTRAAAVEVAGDRIRINTISPGLIVTPASVLFSMEESGKFFDTMQPWPDHGLTDDIASAFVFLASDEARFITGHDLVVDGGHTIHSPLAERYKEWATRKLQGHSR